MEWLSFASDIIGVAGALFAALAWWQARRTRKELDAERRRLAERVSVTLALKSNGQRRELPLALQRAELTRAELLGRLGMLPMVEAGRRFSLSYLGGAGFLDQLGVAQRASGPAVIVIPCSEQEFKQFA